MEKTDYLFGLFMTCAGQIVRYDKYLSDLFLCQCCLSFQKMSLFSLPVTLSRYPDTKEKVKVLYIRIVSPFPEMERFLQDTTKR